MLGRSEYMDQFYRVHKDEKYFFLIYHKLKLKKYFISKEASQEFLEEII